jgi:hypothetical protein
MMKTIGFKYIISGYFQDSYRRYRQRVASATTLNRHPGFVDNHHRFCQLDDFCGYSELRQLARWTGMT